VEMWWWRWRWRWSWSVAAKWHSHFSRNYSTRVCAPQN